MEIEGSPNKYIKAATNSVHFIFEKKTVAARMSPTKNVSLLTMHTKLRTHQSF